MTKGVAFLLLALQLAVLLVGKAHHHDAPGDDHGCGICQVLKHAPGEEAAPATLAFAPLPPAETIGPVVRAPRETAAGLPCVRGPPASL